MEDSSLAGPQSAPSVTSDTETDTTRLQVPAPARNGRRTKILAAVIGAGALMVTAGVGVAVMANRTLSVDGMEKIAAEKHLASIVLPEPTQVVKDVKPETPQETLKPTCRQAIADISDPSKSLGYVRWAGSQQVLFVVMKDNDLAQKNQVDLGQCMTDSGGAATVKVPYSNSKVVWLRSQRLDGTPLLDSVTYRGADLQFYSGSLTSDQVDQFVKDIDRHI